MWQLPQLYTFPRGRPTRIAITIGCQLAFVLFGYDQGVFSGIVGNSSWLSQFGNPGSTLEGIIVSIYNLGAFSGCIICFLFCEKWGRRSSMFIAMLFIIVGGALQSCAYTIPHLMIARFLTGIGTGIETSTVPMYQSELCEAERRGRLVSSEPLFVGVGIEIAYWFDYGMSFVQDGATDISWRLPIACQVIFAIAVVIMTFGLPESPRPAEDEKIVKEQGDVLEALRMEQETGEYRWRDLLKRDEVQTGRRVLLAYGMQFMNQMGGINLVVYYVTSVLENNVGLDRNLALLLGGVINLMFFVGSLFPTFFLDKYGRRKPMMWGSFGLGISMMMISILLSFQMSKDTNPGLASSTASASIAFFFTYMLIFGATANCIPWVYVPEILPLHVRAKGTSVGISANWLWNFFVVMITPTLLDDLAWKGYLIFMCLNFAFIPLVYFCYPETANLTLEEVDWLFVKKGAVKESIRVQKALKQGERPVRFQLHAADDSSEGEKEKTEQVAGHMEHVGGDV